MGRKPLIDYQEAYRQFSMAKLKDPNCNMRDWCKDNGVSYTSFSKKTTNLRQTPIDPKQFNVIKEAIKDQVSEKVETLRKDAREILKNAAPEVAEKLVAMSKEAESENVRLGAANSVLDRAGYAAEKMQVNVNTQINIPVLFSDVKSEDITQLRGEDA